MLFVLVQCGILGDLKMAQFEKLSYLAVESLYCSHDVHRVT